HAGPSGRRDGRRARPPRLRADARHARAAHSPRACHLPHLHKSRAVRPRRDRLPLAPRTARAREPRAGELSPGARGCRPPPGRRGGRARRADELLMFVEPLIFERGSPGRVGWPVPGAAGEGVAELPAHLRREDDLAGMPEVSELEALRHFLRLSQWNYSAATTLYPLGSCTMKYNPVVNEELARLPGFAALHPLVPEGLAQGALALLAALEAALAAVSGLDAVCLQPAAGAHGELLGMLVVRAYHVDRGDARRRVLIPSSAHG